MNQHLKQKTAFPIEFDASTFGRVLAKIAHSYAVAMLGLGNFKSFLPALILTRGGPLSYYVGCGIKSEPSEWLHEIGIVPWDDNLIVVRIRLFANYDMPTYMIVAGQR